jgi:predicted GTPase
MSRSGEMWYSQKTQNNQNIVQNIIKHIKRCFSSENEVNPVYISNVHEDDYGSIRNG